MMDQVSKVCAQDNSIGCYSALRDLKHPVVRRLERAVIAFLPGVEGIDKTKLSGTRLKMIIRSIAIPTACLWRHMAMGNASEQNKGKFTASFNEAIAFLCKLDADTDQDLDFLKYWFSTWMQLGVNDAGNSSMENSTGHVIPKPSSTISSLCEQRKGVFRGFLKRAINLQVMKAKAGSKGSRSLLASFLLSKRGWPELGRHKRVETVRDHQIYLSTQPATLSQDVLDSIQFVSCRFIGKKKVTEFSKLNPSRNASFHNSRKNGGAFAEVATEFVIPVEKSLREISWNFDSWKRDVFHRCEDHVIADQVRQSLTGEPQRAVRVQVIPEPGKFRIITAGDANLYTYLQPLQGFLLKRWAKSRYSTMSDDWESQIENWDQIPQGWVWNSGDYKAATDQLNMNCTLAVVEVLCDLLDLPEWAGLQFPTDLDGTEIVYSAADVEGTELPRRVWQTNGQLMGHPLSFPILCLINLAGLELSLKRAIKAGRMSKQDADRIRDHTKINGDDILFPCPAEHCSIWEKCTAEVGLKLSIGKSYATRDFAMVNNVMFNMSSEKGNRRIGYVNQTLVLNHSLKGGDSEKTPWEIGRAFNRMFEYCPDAREFLVDSAQGRMGKLINGVFKSSLPLVGYEPNFFAPCPLGGLGVDPKFAEEAHVKVRFTATQRRVATLFAEGVMNSFAFANGKPVQGPIADLLKRLPKQVKLRRRYIHSSDLGNEYLMRITAFGFENESSDESLKEWIAHISSFAQLEEPKQKRLRLPRLNTVRKMGVSKILHWSEGMILYPQLPAPARSFKIRYG